MAKKLLSQNISLISKHFTDVCKANGTTEEEFYEKILTLGLDFDTINYERAKLIVKTINQGWTPDFNNRQQTKYYPWFEVSASGIGFSGSHYDYTRTITAVGSLLCTDTQDKAKYIAAQFEDLYKDYFLIL